MNGKHILVGIVCLAMASAIACKVDIYEQAYATDHQASDVPVFMRFLGEGRSIVSSMSVLKADLYFHGGVGHFDDEHEGGLALGEEEHEACEHPEDHKLPEPNPYNLLFRLSRAIGVTEHIHLQGDQIKEIIPWLYYAAEVDPHNVQAYVLTGFYLCSRLGKVDEGIDFLREGLKKNPESWEIYAELGRIYFQYRKNYEASAQYLFEAIVLMQKEPHDKFQERYVLSYLARSYVALGRESDALPLYDRLNALFPNTNYREILRNGEKH